MPHHQPSHHPASHMPVTCRICHRPYVKGAECPDPDPFSDFWADMAARDEAQADMDREKAASLQGEALEAEADLHHYWKP